MRGARGPSRRSLRSELSVSLAVIVCLGILVVGSLLYRHQRHALEMYLGMSLQNVAQTAVSFVDGELYARAGDPTRSPKQAGELRRILERVKAENPLTVEVYTLDPLPAGDFRVAVTAGDGTRAAGQTYRPGPATRPVLERVLREAASAYSPVYLDERGHCLSAFAPIRDSRGVPVAVLGVDYGADVLWGELSMFRWRILGFSLTGALVALVSGVWFARRITRPLERMAEQAREVAQGDFSRRLAPAGTVEVAGLAETLNRMAAQIQAQLDALQRAQLDRAHEDRLASLGAVAAELVHEMTQPLTAIQGISQGILEQSAELSAETRQYLRVVVDEARRLRELSQRLREFSRRSQGERRPADLNEIVRDTCLLLRPTARRHEVRIEEQLAPELPEVVVDRQAVAQVLLNLMTNALHAVESRAQPHVRVGTRVVVSGRESAVEVVVEDNGPGIAPEVLPHIFEPFFSTKEPGRGTGLGLSVSKEIVERHGGTMRVEPAPGGGARFVASLPVQPAGHPGVSAVPAPARA
ncbi:MAG TPA: ATP-binding protein [Candidatus Methylomirabilis sp.]|nr:ATP-binding protein [Candidatus Methylomirabilis sp.]